MVSSSRMWVCPSAPRRRGASTSPSSDAGSDRWTSWGSLAHASHVPLEFFRDEGEAVLLDRCPARLCDEGRTEPRLCALDEALPCVGIGTDHALNEHVLGAVALVVPAHLRLVEVGPLELQVVRHNAVSLLAVRLAPQLLPPGACDGQVQDALHLWRFERSLNAWPVCLPVEVDGILKDPTRTHYFVPPGSNSGSGSNSSSSTDFSSYSSSSSYYYCLY